MLKGKKLNIEPTYLKILIACFALGLMLLGFDFFETRLAFDGTIKRAEPGAGSTTENLEVDFLDEHENLEVEISEKGLTSEEITKIFKKAKKEIDNTYLGNNQSADQVSDDLVLKSQYCDGLVNAYWTFDEYGFITSEGKLETENIPSNGQVVNIVGQLSYGEEVRLYSFSVFVCRKGLDTLEGQIAAINDATRTANESTKTNENLELPKQIENMNLTWKRKMDFRGLHLIILGLITVIALQLGKKQDEKKARGLIIKEKEDDYPMIVSELSILISAGMSFRKALERIVSRYMVKRNAGQKRAGYEDIACTYRRICDGAGEIRALEEMGSKSDSKEYRKLAMMLVQSLKKGSSDLINALEKEENYAFEMRKQMAIRAGEEASTKLLIPMAGMLFIVIIVLVVPAMMQMNI